MNLVIVESPTKARTISKFLGKDYTIKASMGHIMDLPKSVLGVDVEHNFTPQYEMVKDKKDVVSDLKKSLKDYEKIILATDPDREGEAIASHVKEVLSSDGANFERIVFHEITKGAIEEALKSPRDIDKNLVDAQTARRVLDRLVGYKLSPLLWKKVRRGLSAGRVQSIALRLIVEREREIERFSREKYWTVTATLNRSTANKKQLTANELEVGTEFELIEINDEKIEKKETFSLYDGEYSVSKTSISDINSAQKIVQALNGEEFKVLDVLKKETKRSPLPPFTTSTMEQEGARRLSFSARRTMTLAQKLYEEGFITYHRTDSISISNSALFSIRGYVEKVYGSKYIPEKPRFYKTKQKLAQEAHEAIRPTSVSVQKVEELGRDHAKLYDLIWRRAVSSQMSDSIVESTTVTAQAGLYTFKANGSILIFDGFLKVNPQALSDNVLPQYKSGEVLTAQKIEEKEHETLPPPRYNDASLIKTLEEKGIGRPSTYATIIDTIQNRQYTEKEEGRFKPTNVGNAVNDFLVANFSTIDDIPFTAEMEDELDSVASGEKPWVPVVKDFYGPFEEKVQKTESSGRVKIEVEETNETCPQCDSKLIIRIGRFGKFMACSAFPKCRFTKPFIEETNLICPRCLPAGRQGGKIVIKKTKRGRRFYGCSNYPKCDFAAWKLSDIKKSSPKE